MSERRGVPDAWGGACGRGGTGTWVPTGTAFTAGVVPVTTGGTAGGAFTTGGTAAGAAEFEVGKRFPMRAGARSLSDNHREDQPLFTLPETVPAPFSPA